jgi:hypothetical protein
MHGGGPQIAPAPDGTIYVAYTDDSTFGEETLRLATRESGGGSFVTTSIDSERYGAAGSLLVDADGGLHVSYFDGSSASTYLHYGYRAPGSSMWTLVQGDTSIRSGNNSTLGVAPDGTVHIVHSVSGTTDAAENLRWDLRYSRKAPGGSFTGVTLADAGRVGEAASMVLDPSGVVHTVYGNRNETADEEEWTLDYQRVCPD